MVHKSDRIFITGGTGLIGSYIIRTLLKEGYTNLVALHRDTSSFNLLGEQKEEVDWEIGDIENVSDIYTLVKGVDIIIHAAAIVSFDDRDSEAMISANQDGTANLINAALANTIKKFIHISSVAALGKPESGNIINESTEWVDSKNNSPYSLSKRASELEVWRGHAEGLKVSVLCPSVVLGAGNWSQTSAKIIANMHRGQKLYPAGGNGFVDVRDVAKAVVKLLDADHNGQRFLINGGNLLFKEFMDEMATNYNIPKPKRAIAKWMIPVSWRLFGLISFITRKPTVYAKHTVISTSKIWKYDNHKSIEKLGMTYIPLKQTIKESCDAFLFSQKEDLTYGKLEIV